MLKNSHCVERSNRRLFVSKTDAGRVHQETMPGEIGMDDGAIWTRSRIRIGSTQAGDIPDVDDAGNVQPSWTAQIEKIRADIEASGESILTAAELRHLCPGLIASVQWEEIAKIALTQRWAFTFSPTAMCGPRNFELEYPVAVKRCERLVTLPG